MRFLKALWLTVFFFFSLIFFIQNNDALGHKLSLKFDFYYFNYVWSNTAVPFYFVVLVGFLAGAIVTLGYLAMDRVRMRIELSSCRRAIRKQEKELNKFRNTPLQATPLLESSSTEKTEQESKNAA